MTLLYSEGDINLVIRLGKYTVVFHI